MEICTCSRYIKTSNSVLACSSCLEKNATNHSDEFEPENRRCLFWLHPQANQLDPVWYIWNWGFFCWFEIFTQASSLPKSPGGFGEDPIEFSKLGMIFCCLKNDISRGEKPSLVDESGQIRVTSARRLVTPESSLVWENPPKIASIPD